MTQKQIRILHAVSSALHTLNSSSFPLRTDKLAVTSSIPWIPHNGPVLPLCFVLLGCSQDPAGKSSVITTKISSVCLHSFAHWVAPSQATQWVLLFLPFFFSLLLLLPHCSNHCRASELWLENWLLPSVKKRKKEEKHLFCLTSVNLMAMWMCF